MKVNFNLVRIGKIRKSPASELILEKNVEFLIKNIRYLLGNEVSDNKNNAIDLDIIIPDRGYNIKISLSHLKNGRIKTIIKSNFAKSIYIGSYDVILDNAHNKVF